MPEHICPHCERPLTRNTILNEHIRIHTGERPYSCDSCPKSFKRAGELYSHRKIHNEREFVCQRTGPGGIACGKKFTRQRDLVRHYGSCRNPSQATENTPLNEISSEPLVATQAESSNSITAPLPAHPAHPPTQASTVIVPIRQDEEVVEMGNLCWTGPSMTARKPLWGEANWDSGSNLWPVRQPGDQSCLVDARKSSISISTREYTPDTGPRVGTRALSRSQKTSAARVSRLESLGRHDFMNDPLSNFLLSDSLIYDGERCLSRALGSFLLQYTNSMFMAPESDLCSAAYLDHYGGLIESARFLMQRRNLSVAINCSMILGAVADICAPGSGDVHHAFLYRAQKSYSGYLPDWAFSPDDIAFFSERIQVVCLVASRYLSWKIRQEVDAVAVAEILIKFGKLVRALLCVGVTFVSMKTPDRAKAHYGSDARSKVAMSRPSIVALLSSFYNTIRDASRAVKSIITEVVSVTANGSLASQASLRKKLEEFKELFGDMAALLGEI